jgi:hypothetical protein
VAEAAQSGQRIVIAVDEQVPGCLEAARRSARQLSYELKETALVVQLPSDQLEQLRTLLESGSVLGQAISSNTGPAPVASAAPMAAAPFVWRADGRPDWGNMWQGFCELALFGGPPHRGEESTLRATQEPAAHTAAESDTIAEIMRGIKETTGLDSELAEPGWLAVQCDSPKMAAWLCATILLENVDARCEGDRLLVPAASIFELKDQVKSIITVVAKTHHYWRNHLAEATSSAQRTAAPAQ